MFHERGGAQTGEEKMMHGLVHDSAIIGTAKHVAHAGRGRKHRHHRRNQSSVVGAVIFILSILIVIFGE